MKETVSDHSEQPVPITNGFPACWSLVIQEMQERDQLGLERYGTRLQPFNGRDALRDVTEELLDAVVYNRQLHFELAQLYKDLIMLKQLLGSAVSSVASLDLLDHIFKTYPFLH